MTGFPKTYDAIREMVRGEILKTATARAIARKSGIRTSVAPNEDGGGSGGSTLEFLARLAYSFAGTTYYLLGIRRLAPYTDPDNIAQTAGYEVIDSTLGGRLVAPKAGLYRLFATSSFFWQLYQWPMLLRMEAVVRTEGGDFVSQSLVQEIYFSAEPQASYTPSAPPGSPPRWAWQGVSEFYLHGEAFVEAEVGQTISAEITWEFAGTNGPGGDLSQVMSSTDGLSDYHQFIEFLG